MENNNNQKPCLPTMNTTSDWRSQLPPHSRNRIMKKIMETLKKHLPSSGKEETDALKNIAIKFEEKIYNNAVDQSDYLRKISMKMLTMENSQTAAGSSSSIPAAANNGTRTPMDSIPTNQGRHLLPGSLPTNQSQAPQPLMSHTMQSNTASGVPGSVGLPSSMPLVSSITNNDVTSAVNQNSNVAGMLQDSSRQHGLSSNMFSGPQRQMLVRPHAMSSQQQQQPQSAQYLYQQQQQPQSAQYLYQQQQQNVLQRNQLHSSQQPGIPSSTTQPSTVNSAPLQGLHANQQSSPQLSDQQTQSTLHQYQPSLLRSHPQSQQASGMPQQQTQMMRENAANSSGSQQKQTMGQHVMGDVQQQRQQRLMNIQKQQSQQQPPAQQQLMPQDNSLQATHQQPRGSQSNVAGLQQRQQQLHSSQAGNSNLKTNPHSVHMLSQPTAGVQRTHQASHGLISSQGQQQSQSQLSQQQMMPQLQSRHQQLGLQQQPNLIQQDVQQRLQVSDQVTGSLLPPQNVVDQQRQLYQSQRTLPEMPSSSTAHTENTNGGDWQEEVYQKIKSMEEKYLPDLNKLYQRVISKMQQISLPQQQRSDQFEKLKRIRTMLEGMIRFLSSPKEKYMKYSMPLLRENMAYYEKQIIGILKLDRPRRTMQQGQLPQSQMQQPQSQTVQDQTHDSQTNQQMQSVSIQGSRLRAQQSSLNNMQNNVLSSRYVQNIPNSIPASSLESGQGNALNNGKQVAMGSTQKVNNRSASAQSGLSTLQSNVNQPQLSSSLLQHKHMNHIPKEQFQQRQKQQVIQQQQQPQLRAAQLQQINDLTARQGMNASRGMLQEHSLQGHATNPLQQLKPGSQLSVSSPQVLKGASPQMTQRLMSPKVEQKTLPSVNKMGTPLQSANSPFVVPSPATPLVPSPVQVDSDKSSSLSMRNIARQQATGMQGVVKSLAVDTPGISASSLLQEDGNNLNPSTSTSEKPSASELPIDRLIRAVKSISPQALRSAVSDIESVVSMADRIAGSAPGNGSRASVGADLAAMNKCRLQARNFMMQEGMMATKKMKRHITASPLSVGDNSEQFVCSETSDLESTVCKKARTEEWFSVRLPLGVSEN